MENVNNVYKTVCTGELTKMDHLFKGYAPVDSDMRHRAVHYNLNTKKVINY